MTEILPEGNILQIHYYLENNKHSMNAVALNKAESELLKLFSEISNTLGIDIIIETKALEEGGIKSIYKFFTKKKYKKRLYPIVIPAVISIISGVITNVTSNIINEDEELIELQKEKIRLEILKLKNELNAEEKEGELIFEGDNLKKELSTENLNEISDYISNGNKVKVYKSNFYRSINKEPKIVKVSTQLLNDKQVPISEEKMVSKEEFKNFIIKDNNIESEYHQQIELEIISPVLKNTSFKWRAIFNDNVISFTLKDKKFKKLISSKNLKFSNETKLVCDLEIKRKVNNDGEIILGAKSVYSVSAILYPDGERVDIID